MEGDVAAFVIANIDVKDPVRYQDYIKMSPVSIAKFGGRFVARGGKTEVLEGNWVPKRLVLLEFPSLSAPGSGGPPTITLPPRPSVRRRPTASWSSSKVCETTEAQRHRP